MDNGHLSSNGHFDLDLYLERMEGSHVQRAIAGVRKMEESVGKRRVAPEIEEIQAELRRNLSEWSGL